MLLSPLENVLSRPAGVLRSYLRHLRFNGTGVSMEINGGSCLTGVFMQRWKSIFVLSVLCVCVNNCLILSLCQLPYCNRSGRGSGSVHPLQVRGECHCRFKALSGFNGASLICRSRRGSNAVTARFPPITLPLPPLCLQLANPDSVEGLVLVNIDTNARGWIDWAAQKVRSTSSESHKHVVF